MGAAHAQKLSPSPRPPPHFLGRRRLYRVRAAAKGQAEVTAGSQPLAAAARVKPEWTAFLEQLVPHFSGVTESSGEAEDGVKKPDHHLPVLMDTSPLNIWPGRGRGAAQTSESVRRRRLSRMRPGRC